jgi:hypothetical protein
MSVWNSALAFEPDNKLLLASKGRLASTDADTEAEKVSSDDGEVKDRERRVCVDFAECWPGIE